MQMEVEIQESGNIAMDKRAGSSLATDRAVTLAPTRSWAQTGQYGMSGMGPMVPKGTPGDEHLPLRDGYDDGEVRAQAFHVVRAPTPS